MAANDALNPFRSTESIAARRKPDSPTKALGWGLNGLCLQGERKRARIIVPQPSIHRQHPMSLSCEPGVYDDAVLIDQAAADNGGILLQLEPLGCLPQPVLS